MVSAANGIAVSDQIVDYMWFGQGKFNAGAMKMEVRLSNFRNTFTNDEAMLIIESFIDLLEKYENTLLEISKSALPKKIKDRATEALAYGNELIDGPLDCHEVY